MQDSRYKKLSVGRGHVCWRCGSDLCVDSFTKGGCKKTSKDAKFVRNKLKKEARKEIEENLPV